MEQMATDQEAMAYSYSALQSSIQQHEMNIATYQDVIKNEQERIEWIRAVIKRKQELEDGNDIV